jgi:biopolymer transport protein ExbB
MIAEFIREVFEYLGKGGFVMPPLALGTIVLWYSLGYRYSTLKRGNSRSVRILVDKYQKGYERKPSGIIDGAVVKAIGILKEGAHSLPNRIEDAFSEFRNEIARFSLLIKIIVMVSPLMGLLGTVTGMIETFDSLGDMSLYSQSGGIAGGISQALFTTQMGLAVSVPGLVVGRILDKRQKEMERELEQIKKMVVCIPSGGEK